MSAYVFEQHRSYLSDEARLEAFRTAIHQTVRPGDVVVDIGAGTGVLACWACEAGASRVYAIERDGIIELARKIARANGYADRVRFVRGESSRATIPEPVDMVCADLIGHFAFEAGIFAVLTDARRYLKPGGRTIPAEIRLCLAAAESPELRGALEFWRARPAGLDMTPAYEHARKTAHHLMLPSGSLLTEPLHVGQHMLPLSDVPVIAVQGTTRAARTGTIDALAGWFEATLAPGVDITNDPRAARRLDRRQLVLPITEPIGASAGDEIEVSLRVLPIEHVYRWRLRRRSVNGDVASFEGSTFEGAFVSHEELAHLRRDARPRPTHDGEALRLVLELADGTRSVQEIEDAVAARYADLFPHRARAADFVAEALRRHAR